jgi:hypothetical protein
MRDRLRSHDANPMRRRGRQSALIFRPTAFFRGVDQAAQFLSRAASEPLKRGEGDVVFCERPFAP